jgi:sec-independent protein translocase protein TatB
MFGMSLAEIGIIFLIALVFLGPEKLPELARMLGKGVREIRKAGSMLQEALEFEEEREQLRELKRERDRLADDFERFEYDAGMPLDQQHDFDRALDEHFRAGEEPAPAMREIALAPSEARGPEHVRTVAMSDARPAADREKIHNIPLHTPVEGTSR